jgi:hypothetical protein
MLLPAGPGVGSAGRGRTLYGPKKELAVAAAEQQGEPVRVPAQPIDVAGGVASELPQGRGQACGVAG